MKRKKFGGKKRWMFSKKWIAHTKTSRKGREFCVHNTYELWRRQKKGIHRRHHHHQPSKCFNFLFDFIAFRVLLPFSCFFPFFLVFFMCMFYGSVCIIILYALVWFSIIIITSNKKKLWQKLSRKTKKKIKQIHTTMKLFSVYEVKIKIQKISCCMHFLVIFVFWRCFLVIIAFCALLYRFLFVVSLFDDTFECCVWWIFLFVFLHIFVKKSVSVIHFTEDIITK